MEHQFERGRIYNRRRDIHGPYAGQQQGGIITPAHHPLVIIITGQEGEQHGYSDVLRDDGTFAYFGEGQIGDMPMVRGNRAILEHSKDGKALLLFHKVQGRGLRFDGEWVCGGYEITKAPDRVGTIRNAFVFLLSPLDAVDESDFPVVDPSAGAADISTLRTAAIAAASAGQVAGQTVRTVYQRSRDVRAYVLRRASGHCEGCGCAAPFVRVDGSPYLEPHHIRRVSDGGPDDIRYVIALCPTCHRRVHAGADGPNYNAVLLKQMETIEPRIWV